MISHPPGNNKDLLRAQISAARTNRAASLSMDERIAASARVASAVLDAPLLVGALKASQVVASYLPLASEPDTTALHDALLDQGIQVLVPECVTDEEGQPTLAWIQLDPSQTDAIQLQHDQRGIPIPQGRRVGVGGQGLIDLGCQVILVPALAATGDGQRLGKGAGYYDRLLGELANLDGQDPALHSIAIVFTDELLDQVPTEPHDAPVSAVVAV